MKIQQKIKNQIFWKMDDDKNVNKYLVLLISMNLEIRKRLKRGP